MYSNVSDPGKKSTGAVVKRNKKGTLERTEGENYQGVTNKTLSESRKESVKGGNKQYNSGVAPRTGGDGEYKSLAGAVGLMGNASKKQMRQSNRNINQSSASPQAKKAARRANKRNY